MTSEIRILSIELENYRQYYGKHKINFSTRYEGFTIIAGKNGEGKSNLLNAISWCLYHREPHGMKNMQGNESENMSLSVINNRYIIELDEKKTAKTSVEIQIQVDDTIYSISRILTVIKEKLEFKELSGGKRSLLITKHASDKVPKGCWITNENQKDFVIKKKGRNNVDFHDTIREGDPNTIMGEILPHGLSKYFLLDGEFLEGFWKDSRIIQNGVEQISQLNLLGSLIDHVDKMRIPSKGVGKDTDYLTSQIQTLVWYEKSLDDNGNESFSAEPRWKQSPEEEDTYYHATGKPRVEDLRDDIKRMQDRINTISDTIPQINIPSHKLLKEQYEDLGTRIQDEKAKLDSLGKAYRYNLITKSPYIFLKEAIEESVKIIEKRMNLGDLPVRQRKQFADDLLKRGICICGECLYSGDSSNNEVNGRRINIENFKNDLVGKDELDAAVEMRYDFTHEFIAKYDIFLKSNFGEPRKKFTESEESYNGLSVQLKKVQMQLKDSGSREIKSMIDEQIHLQELIQINNDKITNLELALLSNKGDQTSLKIQLQKELKKYEKAKRLSHELDVWNRIYEHLQRAYKELANEIRINIQNKTWKNFQSLLANPTEFKVFKIEPDYSIYILDQHDVNKIRNLSAGQSLILTLAFVAALREPTGYKFPLVVDSPLGKIDSGNKHNIGRRLPKYLPEEQLILLVTDTEYAAYLPPDADYPNLPNTPFGKLLGEQVSLKHLKIQKEKSGKNTGNSVIKSAELVLDKDKGGWMVNTTV